MKSKRVLVSVIISVYKVKDYIDRCIDSITNQTYSNIEIIIVDDGSPDESASNSDKYLRYPRMRVIHKINDGLSSARLAGFREAQGDLILFVDSDDYISLEMVEKLVEAIQTNDADMALCGYNLVKNKRIKQCLLPYNVNNLYGRASIESNYILPLLGYSKTGINIPGFLWIRLLKKSLIEEANFVSERLYYKEDHVFDLLYADSINRITIVNEPLYYYCYNENSLSNSYRNNKWLMYCNLHDFYNDYLQRRNLDDSQHRLDNYIVAAFCACIDNAVMTGDFQSFFKEMKTILSSTAMHSVWLATDSASLPNSARLSLFLCKIHAYRALYLIRKYRLKRSACKE